MTNLSRPEMAEASAHISAVVEDVFTTLFDMRDGVVSGNRQALADGRRLRSGDLATLRPVFFEHLRRNATLVTGIGVITAPGKLEDVNRWLEWWHAASGEEPRFLEVDLDPESVNFYDYTAADWFEIPQRSGQRALVGPYVDYGGADDYVLTLTVPIIADDVFLGVTGADIPARSFEAVVLPILQRIDAKAMLTNTAGRVIASNTPNQLTGSLYKSPHSASSSEYSGRQADEPMSQPCAGLPWTLVVLRSE